MNFNSIDDLKKQLQSAGFDQRAYLDDADMANAQALFDKDPRVVGTPEQELRYIEGLFDLPLGYITDFKVIPAVGYEKCKCGRIPTALDVVYLAHKKHIHSKELIRDTLIGFKNIFEIATSGRTTECFSCGRKVEIMAYSRSKPYIYA